MSFSSCGWGSNFSGRWRRGTILINPQPCIFFIQKGQNIICVCQQMSKSCLSSVMVGRKWILSNSIQLLTFIITDVSHTAEYCFVTFDWRLFCKIQFCDCYYASSMSLDHFWTSSCWGGGGYTPVLQADTSDFRSTSLVPRHRININHITHLLPYCPIL